MNVANRYKKLFIEFFVCFKDNLMTSLVLFTKCNRLFHQGFQLLPNFSLLLLPHLSDDDDVIDDSFLTLQLEQHY